MWVLEVSNSRSEFPKSEFSRTRNLRYLEKWLRFSTQFYMNDNYRFLSTNTWTAKFFFISTHVILFIFQGVWVSSSSEVSRSDHEFSRHLSQIESNHDQNQNGNSWSCLTPSVKSRNNPATGKRFCIFLFQTRTKTARPDTIRTRAKLFHFRV